MPRTFRHLALACSVVLAGCDTGSFLLGTAGSPNAATVRFVNATAIPLDLAVGGVVTTSNGNIVPGAGIACFSVADPSVPGLSVRQSGTTTDLPGFTLRFTSGGLYTLVAFPGPAGTQFISVPNAFIPIAGRSALRVLNASSGLGNVDVFVTAPGADLGTANVTGVGFGNASGSFDVNTGAIQVRLTTSGSTTVVFDAGSRLLVPGESYTLIVSSATSAILVPDCV